MISDGPDSATIDRIGVPTSEQSFYNLCISSNSGFQIRCRAQDFNPTAGVSLAIFPTAHRNIVSCSAGKDVCTYNVIPEHGGRYSAQCEAENGAFRDKRSLSSVYQIDVRGNYENEM